MSPVSATFPRLTVVTECVSREYLDESSIRYARFQTRKVMKLLRKRIINKPCSYEYVR